MTNKNTYFSVQMQSAEFILYRNKKDTHPSKPPLYSLKSVRFQVSEARAHNSKLFGLEKSKNHVWNLKKKKKKNFCHHI